MIVLLRRAATVLQQQTFEATVIGVAHGGVHAAICGNSRNDEIANTPIAKDLLEVGGVKSSLPRLIDYRLTRLGR